MPGGFSVYEGNVILNSVFDSGGLMDRLVYNGPERGWHECYGAGRQQLLAHGNHGGGLGDLFGPGDQQRERGHQRDGFGQLGRDTLLRFV